MNKWISVKDRLPEVPEGAFFSKDVLVTDGESVCVDTLFVDAFDRKTRHFSLDSGDVTHWMPLPEPPKEEDHDNV